MYVKAFYFVKDKSFIFNDIYGLAKKKKEFESIIEEESPIRAQEFFGDCCKEQYSALLKCFMKQI